MEIGRSNQQNLGFGAVIFKLKGKVDNPKSDPIDLMQNIIISTKNNYGGKYDRVDLGKHTAIKYEGPDYPDNHTVPLEDSVEAFFEYMKKVISDKLELFKITRTNSPEETAKIWKEHTDWVGASIDGN